MYTGSIINKQFRQALISTVLALMLFATSALQAEERTLNMKDADIRALIAQVAEMTGYNFIVDPRVKGNVTVISSRPMSADEVYQVFLSILTVHGFSAIRAGDVVKVIPETRAKQTSIPTGDPNEIDARGFEMVTRVLQVQNATASQLIPILRPLVPQHGHLAAYPPTNVIIISDEAANIDRLVNIIRRIDTASSEDIDLIALKHASAVEVVRLLDSLEKNNSGQGDLGSKGPRFVADGRTNTILLTGETAARLRLRQLIQQLDQPLRANGNTRVYYLKYAKALDLVPILDGISGTIADEKSESGVSTGTINIQADESTNAIIVSASPDIQSAIQSVITSLDIRRAQVLVEAVIAEVELDKVRELGIEWAFNKDGALIGGAQFGNLSSQSIGQVIDTIAAGEAGQAVQGGVANSILGNGASLGIGRFELKGFGMSALIRALANDVRANLLSTPTLMTLDNVEAEIVVGQSVPFVTGSFVNSGNNNGAENPFQTIEREDVGVILRVTPHINEGGAITLEIEQEVSAVADAVDGQNQADLITNKRNIKTTILVEDQETIVLGGLITNDVRETVRKVPLLGDIPYLGELFRSTETKRDRNNLMVFLRPRVLRDSVSASRLSNEKYHYIRESQLERQAQGTHLMPNDETPLLPEWGSSLSVPPTFEEEYRESVGGTLH